MRSALVAQLLALAASTSMASAQPVRWTTYTIPETGTSVDFPASVFSEEAGQPDGGWYRHRLDQHGGDHGGELGRAWCDVGTDVR